MKFIMQRDIVVATKHGHAIEFKKGMPTYVVKSCWDDVQEKGAVPYEGEGEEVAQEPKKATIPEGEARTALIVEAMRQIILKNDRNSFTASGSPGVSGISAIVGFIVAGSERDKIWFKMQQEDGAAAGAAG